MQSQPITLSVGGNAAAKRCLEFYDDLDKVVSEYGVSPSRPERITGFPYLRMTRFLASFSQQNLDDAALQSWLMRLVDLDQQARSIELASLESSVKSELKSIYDVDLAGFLTECVETLLSVDRANPERMALLRNRAVTNSEYLLLNQILGLYPLSSIPVKMGIRRYHEKTLAVYAEPLEMLPIYGQLHRFQIPREDGIDPPGMLVRDDLGIPNPTGTQLQALFKIHAPVWEIDVVGSYDLPGKPFWHAEGKPDVDHSIALVYHYPSYTHWQDRALLQLNYLIWFSERPRVSTYDIFGGKLDGLLWRVTLNTDGTVLIYDSMHACGCYHYFFPTTALALRPEAKHLPEPPLLPQLAPQLAAGKSLVIRVATGNHYIQRLYADTPSGQPLHWRKYRELYATPFVGGGQRSLFRSDGLVAGSVRLERWLLWPMGIPSPGAMRERGRQATAFVGLRHFDDAQLLNHLFEPVQ